MLSAMAGHPSVSIARHVLGKCPDGSEALSFTLENGTLELGVTSYGARIMFLLAPDRHGTHADVVLGFKSLSDYLQDDQFLGATPGRYANRIADGRFTLDGTTYSLSTNDGPNTLHGGKVGFGVRNWSGIALKDAVEFTLKSSDGDQGFPGNLTATVRYTLQGNTVHMEYTATTDKPTVVNLTNHAYYNLAGEGTPSVLEHQVQISAQSYTPVGPHGIPLGPAAPVAGTPFDFTTAHTLGERINADDEQLHRASGYDHNFILDGERGTLRHAATVVEPVSGRQLTVATNEPGIQLYSGNYLKGVMHGPSGRPYVRRCALCLEAEHFPDSPNHPDYPTTVLRPGQTYRSTTTLSFSTG